MKLNVLLGVTDSLKHKFKNMVKSYQQFFKNKQGAFAGVKKTYVAKADCADDPTKRAFIPVITTVDEKFKYFIQEAGPFVDGLFSQEKTNSIGIACAELVVDGKSWGEFSSLELLRFKSLLESGELGDIGAMIEEIPTKEDSLVWIQSTDEDLVKRGIYETERLSGISRSSEATEYILDDPNLSKLSDSSSYKPVVSTKRTIIEVGNYTVQQFTGAWTQVQRAYALKRKNDLLIAVVAALKSCNDCETVKSSLTAKKIFGYILYDENE